MQDFDPDAWMSKQKKTATTPAPAADFDPDAWMAKQKQERPRPRTLMPTERQEFNQPHFDLDADLRLARQRQLRADMEITPRVSPGGPNDPFNESLRDMARRGFERKPLSERFSERAYDALARGGGQLSRMARQTAEAGMGVARGLNSGDFTPVPIEGWRKFEHERDAELAQRQANRPAGGFLTETGENIIEAAGPASAAYLLTAAGVPPWVAGGSMAAAGADWSDPKRATAQTALGVAAPYLGGKAGQRVIGPAAARVVGPAAERAIGEIVGGGAGNVLGSSAESLAFEGRLPSRRELTKQFAVGSALSAPGALSSLRPSARVPRETGPQEVRATQPLGPAVEQFPDVPETQRMPALSRAELEAAPTAELPAPRRAPEQRRLPFDTEEMPTVIHPNPEIDRKPVLAKTGDGRVIVENPANKGGVSVVKDRSNEPAEHKFSSTQINLPKDVGDEILAFGDLIPNRDLADDGRETTPHITLKYGLHGWDPKIVEQALQGEGPIKVKFGKTSVFHNDDADVVKVDVDSPDLHRLNQKIADAHPNTETHPTYEPHATIAYVRSGQGSKYAGDNFIEGRTVTLDRITFSGRDGRQVEIPLTGRKASAPAESAQVAGEPVSPRWLNAQRRQAAELLGIDPDSIPLVEESPPSAQAPVVEPAPQRKAAGGQILGSGLGALQGLFEKAPAASSASSRRGRLAETVGAAQAVAQMGSPGFVARNVIQHISHGAQEAATRAVAGLIDKAVSAVTGKRAVGGFSSPLDAAREAKQFFADYAAGVKAAREAHRRGEPLPGSRLRDLPEPATLTAVGRRLSNVLTWINAIPDAGNWNAHFQASLRDQAKALRTPRAKRANPSSDESLQRVDQMIERAWAEADHASLRDPNFVSKTLNTFKKTLNTLSSPITGTDKFGLGDFVVKYTQVPGAIVKRGIEYSPLGVVEAGYHATKGDQRRAVQSLARAVVGSTSGAGLGAMLAAYGVLVGPDHDVGQLGQLEREEGRRGYSINISALKRLAAGGFLDADEVGKLQAGDQLVGIDWLQPWALQASTGAAIYNAAKRGDLAQVGFTPADTLGQWLAVADDQTVLKNLRQAIPYGGDPDALWATFRRIATSAPASFVPSLARQARQVADPFVRDVRPEDPKGLRGFIAEATHRVEEGLPGLSQALPTRASVLTGKPKKTAIGGYSLPLRSLKMASPAPFTTYEPSPIAREASRLTDAGFKVAFTPPKREKGERTSILRRREEKFAETFSNAAERMFASPDYQVAPDQAKAEAINDLAKHLRERTRKEIAEKTLGEIIERAAVRTMRAEGREATKGK